MIKKIIASLITGIGGHYLNDRWDKAILFLILFVLYLAGVSTFLVFSVQSILPSSDDMLQEMADINKLVSKIASTGIVALWLLSLYITILDARKDKEPFISRWTKVGVVVAVITSFFSFVIFVATIANCFSKSVVEMDDYEATEYESNSFSTKSYNFFEYLYLGGSPNNAHKLPPPPSGEGKLKGRIMYQNAPAVGVTLAVVLNSKYKTKKIVTDSEGIFTIDLPEGTWSINSIQTESWQNKPEGGGFTLYSGREEKLQGDTYSRYRRLPENGLPVEVTTDSESILFEATISKDIQLQWPSPTSQGTKATINDIIQWQKYDGAVRYYVEIKRIKREGSSSYYEQVASRIVVDETSMPLADFKHMDTGTKDSVEYAAEIYAFSEDGVLIAQFSDTYQGGTFKLSDGNILIEEKMDDLFNLSSIEDPDEFEKKMKKISSNKERTQAVSVLIHDNLLTEAETLMRLVDSELSQGQKEVLSGYIFDLRGKCEDSEEMFNKALSINPDICIPNDYRKNCERY